MLEPRLRERIARLLDVNGRFWTWNGLGPLAGVDFPYLAFRQALRQAVSPCRGRPGVRLDARQPRYGGRLSRNYERQPDDRRLSGEFPQAADFYEFRTRGPHAGDRRVGRSRFGIGSPAASSARCGTRSRKRLRGNSELPLAGSPNSAARDGAPGLRQSRQRDRLDLDFEAVLQHGHWHYRACRPRCAGPGRIDRVESGP